MTSLNINEIQMVNRLDRKQEKHKERIYGIDLPQEVRHCATDSESNPHHLQAFKRSIRRKIRFAKKNG